MTFKRFSVTERGAPMANQFSEQERRLLRERLLEAGFALLRQGGVRAVNIDVLTAQCFIAKGTFYRFFASKTDFLYAVMRYKRRQAKEKLADFLDEGGALSRQGLHGYLQWLCRENPNIFAYLDEQETRWLVSKWPRAYLEDEGNDQATAFWLLAHLADPRPAPDWQLFCNLLKLAAWTLNSRELLLADAYQQTIDLLLENACRCLCR